MAVLEFIVIKRKKNFWLVKNQQGTPRYSIYQIAQKGYDHEMIRFCDFKNLRRAGKVFSKMAIIILLLLLPTNISFAEVNPERAMDAAMGEARGEGSRWNDWYGKEIAMRAILEAIRNRGNLNSVYGKDAVNHDPEWIQEKCRAIAQKAWQDSKRPSLVNGATHWGNEKDLEAFRKTRWFKEYVQVAKIGHHYFFKKIKSGGKNAKKIRSNHSGNVVHA